MRVELVLVLSLMACRSQPDPSAAAPTASAAPPAKRICEPTITCGVWSRCTWLELDHVEPAHEVFRVAGSGAHYWRSHECWPEDAGRNGCALYCDRTGACVDALSSDSTCTGAAAPRPSPYLCEVRGAECVTLP